MEPEEQDCPVCLAPLSVRNTRTRPIITSNGEQSVTSVTKRCTHHLGTVFRPVTALTPPKRKYGFDIIAEIGISRFLEHRQVKEVHEHFLKRGICIPERTIQNLCQCFLRYVVAVHIEGIPRIARLLEENGGYVLHVDGSTTNGSPELLLMKDGWSGIRLLAASIASESKGCVKFYLEMVKEAFGDPVAAIRDMGSGMENALVEVFPNVYILSCHYHFLRLVGHRLFDSIYRGFQKRVDNTGIKKKLRELRKSFRQRKQTEDRDKALELLEHILTYKSDGNGLAYPFSLPMRDFYRRCEKVRPEVYRFIHERADKHMCSPCLSRLGSALKLLGPPPAVNGRIQSEYLKLETRWNWFEAIRNALRYKNGPIPLNTQGHLSDTELEKGRVKIDELQTRIDIFIKKGDRKNDRTLKRTLSEISKQITERRLELFAPNITVTTNGKDEVRKLPRTNNTIEQDFRSIRRHKRRIHGNSNVERSVQRDGVGMAIVKNLENKNYIRHLYGNINQLHTRFAMVTSASLQQAKALFQTLDEPVLPRNA